MSGLCHVFAEGKERQNSRSVVKRGICPSPKATIAAIAHTKKRQAGDQEKPSHHFPEISPWAWNEQRSQAALKLASGYSWQSTAEKVGVDKRTITNWMQNIEFSAEVDRLSLMVDVSSRAERLRIAMRAIRQKVGEIQIDTSGFDLLKKKSILRADLVANRTKRTREKRRKTPISSLRRLEITANKS